MRCKIRLIRSDWLTRILECFNPSLSTLNACRQSVIDGESCEKKRREREREWIDALRRLAASQAGEALLRQAQRAQPRSSFAPCSGGVWLAAAARTVAAFPPGKVCDSVQLRIDLWGVHDERASGWVTLLVSVASVATYRRGSSLSPYLSFFQREVVLDVVVVSRSKPWEMSLLVLIITANRDPWYFIVNLARISHRRTNMLSFTNIRVALSEL